MKKFLNILMILLAVTVIFTGCKKDTKDPILDTGKTIAPTWTSFPSPDDHFVLTEETADSVVTTLEWTDVVYNISTLPSPLYTVQLLLASGMEDSQWNEPVEMLTIPLTTQTITTSALNTAIIKEIGTEFAADTVISAAFRIKANVNANDVSSTIDAFTEFAPFSVTPYFSSGGEISGLYVPGDYQGWDPATAPQIWSPDNNGKYTGFVYYPEGGTFEFKFTSAPDWNHRNFGAGATEGTLDTDPGAGNLMVPEFGFYKLTCDTIALTWEYEAQSWGVIGSGILNGLWQEDVKLGWDADNGYLSVTIDITEPQDGGELRFKFRANDGWDLNLGLPDPVDGNNLTYDNGADIPMPDGAGNYTFILDMSGLTPTYQLIKN